ncbi:MAG: pyridoxal phosphate-dependent aminotransferase, partial [Fusobacteriaceae bacterium]
MELSNRIKRLRTSPVRKLVSYSEAATKAGKKLYYLNIGQPDIETPKAFFEAIANYREPVLKYAHSAGLKELREGIKKYYERKEMNYLLDEILIVNGGSEALQFVLMSICDEDDEILIAEPYYANYNSFFDTLKIKLNAVRTYAESGFHLPSLEKMESKITKKTKAIMLSNPGNPTGVVYTREEMDRIAALAKKYNLYIISDEVYREFVYGDNKAISFGTYKDLEQNVIIIDSISKRYSACGARVGCVISKNKDFMSVIYK